MGQPSDVSSTSVFVVRHAKAGSRHAWDGPDAARPLSKPGRRQAAGLVDQLADQDIKRIIASPFVRCTETVEPLAKRRQLMIEPSPSLEEGAPLEEALRLLEKVAYEPTVLCTHGDVIGELLDHLRRSGVAVDERMEKGSTWILGVEGGDVVGARYVPPPT
jgi:broad specificity phosphatase PhoE